MLKGKIGGLVTGIGLLLSGWASASEAPPNFVVLFTDDLGYGDLQSYGHPYHRTPNLDALAASGQRWTEFYSASPVCSPSRGALMTGRLPVRTGLYGKRIGVYFPGDDGGFPESEVSLPEALAGKGYISGIFGKWHLGDAKHAWPTRHGFDEWWGIAYSNDMNWVEEANIDELIKLSMNPDPAPLQKAVASRVRKTTNPKNEYWNSPVYASRRLAGGFEDVVVEQPMQQATVTRRLTENATRFIRQNADKPFFVYVPYPMPHTPLFRDRAFAGQSLGGRYGDVIEEIDWSVGEIVAALEQAGVVENTLVMFTSDNGPWLTMHNHGGSAGHLRHGKGTTFEGGVRVPAVFSWPGQLAPGVVRSMGSMMDVFPTLAALAGADPTSATDGQDISHTLLTGQATQRQELPYYRNGELYAYRQGDWKIHFITEGAYGQPPQRTTHETPELYHLLSDPGERTNLAQRHPDIVARITAAATAHQKSFEIKPPEFDRRLAKLTGAAAESN